MTVAVALALVATLVASPVLAKTYTFKLGRESSINGTKLEAGTYKLKLNENNEALVYRGKELLTKAQVEVQPAPKGRSGVVYATDGSVREIRINKMIVVFVR
ncbi:MAG: hypothetical protein ACE5IP_10615 [Terriglobia bacterium]